jgi:hypothetical protein
MMAPVNGKSWRLALLALLLAACSSPPIAPPAVRPPPVAAATHEDCGPCCGKDPAAQAGATQGISPANPRNPEVGKDSYANVVVREGTVFYSLTPGAPPGFAVLESTLRDAAGSWAAYYDLVQVTTDPGKDANGAPRSLRDKVRAFQVLAPLCAASGPARANPQFGKGGAIQYYLSPADADKLRPAGIAPISHWAPQPWPNP